MDIPKKLQTIFMNRYAVDSTSELLPTDNSMLVTAAVEQTRIKCETDLPIKCEVDPVTSLAPSFLRDTGSFNVSSNQSWTGTHPPMDGLVQDSSSAGLETNGSSLQSSSLSVTSSEASQSCPAIPTANTKLGSVKELCEICGDTSIGFYWGAFVCEACKKFYSRSCKRSTGAYICTNRNKKNSCAITKSTRTSCPYCRFQKCLSIGMEAPGKGLLDTHNIKQLTCRVCGSPSSGFNFGVLTCEGCKGFFRRRTQNGNCKPEQLVCQAGGNCPINMVSRSQCRACRLQKCLSVGMSKQASRIGRLPNNVRYARIMKNISIDAASPPSNDSTSNEMVSPIGRGATTTSPEPISMSTSVNQETGSVSQLSMSSLATPTSVPLAMPITSHTCIVTPTPVYMATPTSQYLNSHTPVMEKDPPINLDTPAVEPLSFDTSHSSQLSTPVEYESHAISSPERSEYPMDLSLSCPKSHNFSVKTELPISPGERIAELSSLYSEFRRDYYRVITDNEMVKPGVSDHTFAQLVYDCFQGSLLLVVNFSKKVHGFMQLHLEDRIVLTKCSIYRLLLLAASQRYDLETGRHYLFGWKSWDRAPARLVSLYPEYEVLVHHFKYFGRKLKEVACSDEELGLLAVLNTINKDNLADIKDQQAVTSLYDEYMQLLILYTQANHTDPVRRVQELSCALGYCQQAAKEHAGAAKVVINKYPSYAAEAAQQVEIIPQLYKEMFSNTPWEHWDLNR